MRKVRLTIVCVLMIVCHMLPKSAQELASAPKSCCTTHAQFCACLGPHCTDLLSRMCLRTVSTCCSLMVATCFSGTLRSLGSISYLYCSHVKSHHLKSFCQIWCVSYLALYNKLPEIKYLIWQKGLFWLTFWSFWSMIVGLCRFGPIARYHILEGSYFMARKEKKKGTVSQVPTVLLGWTHVQ